MTNASGRNGATTIQFLSAELRAFPGRWNIALRCLLSSAVVLIASQAMQVPFLPMSLFIVFFATQSNVVLTRLVTAAMFVGITLAIAVSVLLAKFTYGFPAWRVVLVVVLMLGCLFMMRASRLGPMFYMIALVIANVQGYFDLVPSAEFVVRAILWAWIAAIYPLLVCVVVNALLLPIEPIQQLKEEAHHQLMQIDGALATLMGERTFDTPLGREDLPGGVIALQKLLRFAWARDKAFRIGQARHLQLALTLSTLREQALRLPRHADAAVVAYVCALRLACRRLDICIQEETRFDLEGIAVPENVANANHAPIDEMWHALRVLAAGGETSAKVEIGPASGLLAPDATTNPVYIRFALKTVLAMMLCYVFYVGVDWSGIHTAMATCLIVAQPSLGGSNRKMQLRAIGALIGGGLAMLLTVFVVPMLDTIAGLLLITLPVLTFSAYLSAGSERISYGGMQIMFTFAVAMLGGFSANADLTDIRDRLVGIGVGIGVSFVVHALLWPESEGKALAMQIGGLLKRVASVIDGDSGGDGASIDPASVSRAWAEFDACDQTLSRVVLEPSWQQSEGEHEKVLMRLRALVAYSRDVLVEASALRSAAESRADRLDSMRKRALAEARTMIADRLRRYAEGLIDSGNAFYTLPDCSGHSPPVPLIRPQGIYLDSELRSLLHRLAERVRYLVIPVGAEDHL
ncbi:hypothetical protein WT27_14120 [Burkholderia territorii]|uniref:Integral membrane bound transporter domain-containing protein n=1 Tax=Burkholderia territorii TaxID=1503055 RepID=A0A105V2U2_9BURK|nr:FUSC family protein [Burkholderia territorii]KVV40016.1 hypothetical protein WT27_14120 [Burkholderia territorii]KVX49070.1 hypothetical protein WT31_19580 [Burkholderia territorii]